MANENTKPPPAENPYTQHHVVVKGDTLSKIAQQYYGKPGVWRKIAEINGITDPRRLRPGRNLYLPAPAELTPSGAR